MPKGGYRPGSGRKPGSRNKRTTALQETIDKQLDKRPEGQREPLDILMEVANTPPPDPSTEDYQKRLERWRDIVVDAAAKAAPYRHARLQAQVNEDGNASDLVQESTRKRAEQLRGG